ncbi:YggT family protein [Geopsychrobacter electrodiphilus]|uniref:YggT family protein n=1 Tax=Geopsychrobacter electrodiphilus TaxID=225196 RepID=UPI00037950CE|nr:YggT family protein [Geopsychrobacter electrodiphilus]
MNTVFIALARLVDLVFNLYIFIVVARALVSWVSPDPYNPIVRFLHNATDPALYRLRKLLPFSTGAIDFSPMILIFLLYLLQGFLVNMLISLGNTF